MKGRTRIVFLPLFLLFSLCAKGQPALETLLDGSEQGKFLPTVLEEIAAEKKTRFYYRPEWINSLQLKESYTGQTLAQLLDDVFSGTELYYLVMYPSVIVIVKDPEQTLRRKRVLEQARQQEARIERYEFGKPDNQNNMSQVTITGLVSDSRTGDPVRFATIISVQTQHGTTTDQNGRYALNIPAGAHVLNFSILDYEATYLDIVAYENGEINLEVDKKTLQLDEVIVQGEISLELSTSRIGKSDLNMRALKRSPAFLGEPDIIKQVQNLPGVTTVGEAASGFNVRGGGVDQNLILYDGIPVFNSSHVFGFFSAFNTDAIRDATFYSGGIPAEYGGRASSVLDMKSADGSYEKWNVKAGIGMITSNVMVDGPLKKKKTSLAASLRSTYSNWLARSIRTDYADLRNSKVSFYDGTVKLAHLFSDQTKLSFTGYSSKDGFKLSGDTTYQWGTWQSSAKLQHQLFPNLSSEFIVGISSYGYGVINSDLLTASRLSYRITTAVAKAGFNYEAGIHKFNFGWQLMQYTFDPGRLTPRSDASNARNFALDKQFSIENAFHFSDEWPITDRINMEAGIRLPVFVSLGPAKFNQYADNAPREVTSVIDTVTFKNFRPIKTYPGIEPRLSSRFTISPTASIKLGYNRIYQFIHLITNTAAVTPVDIWQPSGYYFKPQRADQLSVGLFKDFNEKKFGASSEGYYKAIKNVTDFKDGAKLILNEHLETELLQGKAYSYGIETSFFKNTGKLTGTINYTYSRSFRVIEGNSQAESINGGKKYPASFDQPHIANLSWKYNLTRRHFFTGNFTYHTGRPVTIPISVFTSENMPVAYFSGRNQYRIPDYHRLDVALVIEGNHKRKKWADGTWVFSVYNVYGRKNPYTVFFKSTDAGIPKPYQLSIIGTIFPSVSFNLKF